ncbi:unnamed protein product [Effrenium voratum]|nr:unnamed protein product [Effrenium voratum]|mmetsp:Transcript_134646/g.319158  ORF Transcript_134646/g.319158 Transcript_134646/m.319158 type:complete len:335 (+) Transcript_134646:38-1042(+)
MDFAEESENVSLVRILADVQALLAAQRRIEWKLTGLSKAQLAVNDTLEDFRQDLRDVRNRLAGGPGSPVDDKSRQRSQSRTALAIRSLSRSKSMTGQNSTEQGAQDVPSPEAKARQRPPQLELETEKGVLAEPARSSTSRSPKTQEHQEEVLRLRRADGRVFSQVGRWKKSWGSAKTWTSCRLPGIDVKGEAAGGALERLLQGRLRAISKGVVLTGNSEEATAVREQRRLGMTNVIKYNQMLFDALLDSNFRVPRECIAAAAGSFTTPYKARAPVGVPKEDLIALWWEGEVILYSWLTPEEINHFASTDGDVLLSQWIASCVVNEEALQKLVSL